MAAPELTAAGRPWGRLLTRDELGLLSMLADGYRLKITRTIATSKHQ